jgi:hypothetical protein
MYWHWIRALEDAKPEVLHLFVTNEKDQAPPVPPENGDPMRDLEDALDDDREASIAFEHALTQLLPLIAPTLRSIAVISDGLNSPGAQQLFGSTAFPMLNFVAMNTDFAYNMDWMGPYSYLAPFTPTMPILATLEVELQGSIDRLKLIQKFLEACPTIRHVIMGGFMQHVHGHRTPTYILGRPLPIAAGADSTPVNYGGLFNQFMQGAALLPPLNGDAINILRRMGFDVRIRPGNVEMVEVYPCGEDYSPEAQMDGLIVHPQAEKMPTIQELKAKWERRMQVSLLPECTTYCLIHDSEMCLEYSLISVYMCRVMRLMYEVKYIKLCPVREGAGHKSMFDSHLSGGDVWTRR